MLNLCDLLPIQQSNTGSDFPDVFNPLPSTDQHVSTIDAVKVGDGNAANLQPNLSIFDEHLDNNHSSIHQEPTLPDGVSNVEPLTFDNFSRFDASRKMENNIESE